MKRTSSTMAGRLSPFVQWSMAHLVVGVAIALGAPSSSLAEEEPLREILESHTVQSLEQRGIALDPEHDPSFVKGSNFHAVFIERDPGDRLHNWAGPSSLEQFYPEKPTFQRKHHFVTADRVFRVAGQRRTNIVVRIFVPRPRYVMTMELGLMDEFNELIPAKATQTGVEEFDTENGKLTIYKVRDGSCVGMMKAARSSIVRLSMQKCASTDPVRALASQLNLKRLNSKLES